MAAGAAPADHRLGWPVGSWVVVVPVVAAERWVVAGSAVAVAGSAAARAVEPKAEAEGAAGMRAAVEGVVRASVAAVEVRAAGAGAATAGAGDSMAEGAAGAVPADHTLGWPVGSRAVAVTAVAAVAAERGVVVGSAVVA